jgi:hypothetical protein
MRFRFTATTLFRHVPLAAGFCLITSILWAQASGTGPALSDEEFHRERASTELREEEQQRILGIMPNFNTSNVADAEPLLPQQKLQLALKGALDPFTFVAAGFDSALSQAGNDFGSYGQGTSGYGKRFGASYMDTFDGTMLGNAVFPILLKQDPRYFRKGTGSFGSRLYYAVSSTFKCKDDSGNWEPNYSNFLGNFAAGGLSNLYYPSSDRGLSLTLQRTLVVTAEGTGGAILVEFWPDISRKLFAKRHREGLVPVSQSQPQ